MPNLSILVLGLGQVAIGYDIDRPNLAIKSHLYAIHEYQKLEKIKFDIFAVDPDYIKRDRAFKHFPTIRYFSSLSEIQRDSFDLVINAVPISNLFEVTSEVHNRFAYRNFFIEKPGVANVDEAMEFNRFFSRNSNIHIAYPRRVLKSTTYLKDLLELDSYRSRKIEVSYSGHPENILTHFLDVIESVLPIEVLQKFMDFDNITITQTSENNNNDHAIIFNGESRIVYEKGGMQVSDSKGNRMDFTSEIESQIWHTAKSYLNISRQLESSKFPTRISQFIIKALGRRNG